MRDRLRQPLRRIAAAPRDRAARTAGRVEQTARSPLSPQARARRQARRKRLLIGGAAGALALCLAGGGVAIAMNGSAGSGYRTATAESGTVAQTIDATGTVSSASRADRAFSVAGTVGAVDVAVGDTVSAGQVLASLDPTSLDDAVDTAEQAVADAEQKLEDDIDSQTSTTSTATGSSGTGSTGTGSTGTASDDAASAGSGTVGSGTAGAVGSGAAGSGGSTLADPAVAAAVQAVTAAQRTLLAQYQVAQTALDTSAAAVEASQTTCAPFLGTDDGSGDGTDDGSDGTDASGTGGTGTDTTTGDGTTDGAVTGTSASTARFSVSLLAAVEDDGTTVADLAACQNALTTVLTAQQAVQDAQTALLALSGDLDTAVTAAQQALATAAASSGSATGSTGGGSTGGSTGTDTGASGSTGSTGSAAASGASGSSTGSTAALGTMGGSGTGGSSTVATAADLLADQAAIDQAEAALALAQSRLDLVDLTTPIAGTVAAVSIAAGDEVSASSTSAVITVIGDDGYLVSTSVSLSQVDLVEVGQQATVGLTSVDQQVTGTVTSIGILSTSSTSVPSYTVELALDAGDLTLFNGSSAQVSIAVASSGETLTVPTSAVHVDGSTATVQVLRDGSPVDVEVERGAVGSELTEITSGLSAGDVVVLADLNQQLSSDDEETSSGLTGLGGSSSDSDQQRSFPQGGMPGGGSFGGGSLSGPPGS